MADTEVFGGDGWAVRLPDAYRELPPRPGATAVVQHAATGGPDGAVSYWVAYADGRVVEAGSGQHADPDVTLTSPYSLARQLAVGEVDPSVPFMQGRTKVAGDQAALLRVLATMATEAHRQASASLADHTA